MKPFVVEKKITINAPAVEVWSALTDPEKTKNYFFNCRVFSGWEKGDPIVFKGRMFFIFNILLKGEILEVVPGKLLKYTLRNAGSGGYSTVTDRLDENNGITTLTITDEVGTGEGAEKRFNRSVKGWDKILTGLKKFVERGC